jgi:8-oxo-dGTP diphosphatase
MLFVVAAALIDTRGHIFVQQRPEGKPMAGLWEFPGGKVHENETPEHALIRELKEELNIDVTLTHLTPLSFVTHPLNANTKQPDGRAATALNAEALLLLLLYRCTVWSGIITPQEQQRYRWVDRDTLRMLPMPPADIPLIDFL